MRRDDRRIGRLAVGLLVLPTIVLQAAADPAGAATVDGASGEAPLAATITASGSVARAYDWAIEKSVDATTRPTGSTGNATFHYTVTARAGAVTESGWALEGTVTVSNPATEGGAVTADVAVATTLGGGGSCTVTGGDDVVLPPSGEGTGQVALPYSCSFASAPAATGTVAATVTWDPAGEAASASTSASTTASFTATSELNRTVVVVDDKTVPGQRIVLDPALSWSPGLASTYAYDLALAGGAPGACAPHTNTATLDLPSGTDPSARVTVRACTPEVLPAQAFGRAVGSVTAGCRGTVRTRLSNRSPETVTYTLRVGARERRIAVRSLGHKTYVTQGKASATVTLKVGSTRLDRIRIPQRCEAPAVLPDTGLRAASTW